MSTILKTCWNHQDQFDFLATNRVFQKIFSPSLEIYLQRLSAKHASEICIVNEKLGNFRVNWVIVLFNAWVMSTDSQLTFTCSNPAKDKIKKSVKYVQSQQ